MRWLFTAILLTISTLFAAPSEVIDFYGVASPDIEDNMIKMTCDLYYNQLKEATPSVRDMRDRINSHAKSQNEITFDEDPASKLIFYAFITKLSTGKWSASMFLKNTDSATTYSYTKEYESYYKILMESKSSLVSVLDNLMLQQKSNNTATDINDGAYASLPSDTNTLPFTEEDIKNMSLTLNDISGTWAGEGYVSKVVIMRNGRGFVIMRNGVSMNINVTFVAGDTPQVIVKQVGFSNAAFYAELDRNSAAQAASLNEPIEWNFTQVTATKMTGRKKTLTVDNVTGRITRTSIDCQWNKQ